MGPKSSRPVIRKLDEQFPVATVRRIRRIQSQLASFRLHEGAGRFYAKELELCLESGLLLASVYVATSFLELFVRDMLVHTEARDLPVGRHERSRARDRLEQFYEDATNPQWSFVRIVDELERRGIVEAADCRGIKDYYETIRIPIHHGLTRRYLRGERQANLAENPDDILDVLVLARGIRDRSFEERLENEGIGLVAYAVAFIRKYSARTGGSLPS